MADPLPKTASAFRTIGEVSDQFGVPRHVLRYWESRFPQLRPLQRAGNRRYYRADDIALVARINTLLNHDGYTVKGVQALLAGSADGKTHQAQLAEIAAAGSAPTDILAADILPSLIAVRDRLVQALAQDDVAARL